MALVTLIPFSQNLKFWLDFFYWTEKETICVILNDCLQGKVESIVLAFTSDSVFTYHDVKYKVYVWFGSMRDQYYRQKQLSEIIWKPGVSV